MTIPHSSLLCMRLPAPSGNFIFESFWRTMYPGKDRQAAGTWADRPTFPLDTVTLDFSGCVILVKCLLWFEQVSHPHYRLCLPPRTLPPHYLACLSHRLRVMTRTARGAVWTVMPLLYYYSPHTTSGGGVVGAFLLLHARLMTAFPRRFRGDGWHFYLYHLPLPV